MLLTTKWYTTPAATWPDTVRPGAPTQRSVEPSSRKPVAMLAPNSSPATPSGASIVTTSLLPSPSRVPRSRYTLPRPPTPGLPTTSSSQTSRSISAALTAAPNRAPLSPTLRLSTVASVRR